MREDAPAIGREMTSNPLVRKLGFTGSTEVGKLLMRQCADHVKKVSLELGGNAPFIVFDDADLDVAVSPRSSASSGTPGRPASRRTGCSSRRGSTTRSSSASPAAVEALKVADGFTEGVQVGPLIDEPALEKVESHVADALDRGAELVTGGERHRGAVLPAVHPHRRRPGDADEPGGDLRPGGRDQRASRREDEAIAIANATPYGLAAYYMTTDLARTWRVGEALEYGIVGVNTGLISTEVAPFGGVKESGIGREGSSFGVDDWTELKYWAVGGLAPAGG